MSVELSKVLSVGPNYARVGGAVHITNDVSGIVGALSRSKQLKNLTI